VATCDQIQQHRKLKLCRSKQEILGISVPLSMKCLLHVVWKIILGYVDIVLRNTESFYKTVIPLSVLLIMGKTLPVISISLVSDPLYKRKKQNSGIETLTDKVIYL
jgi:hypothetical protein